MSIHVALNHHTRYRYDRPVALSAHEIRLRPAPHCRTPILSYSLTVKPAAHFVNWQQDVYGNFIARYVFPEKAREFEMTVDLVADMTVINPFDFFVEEYGEEFPFTYEPTLAKDLQAFLEFLPQGPAFEKFFARIDQKLRRTTTFLVDMNQLLCKQIKYVIRMEPGVQTPEETLVKGTGSCRDLSLIHI